MTPISTLTGSYRSEIFFNNMYFDVEWRVIRGRSIIDKCLNAGTKQDAILAIYSTNSMDEFRAALNARALQIEDARKKSNTNI